MLGVTDFTIFIGGWLLTVLGSGDGQGGEDGLRHPAEAPATAATADQMGVPSDCGLCSAQNMHNSSEAYPSYSVQHVGAHSFIHSMNIYSGQALF